MKNSLLKNSLRIFENYHYEIKHIAIKIFSVYNFVEKYLSFQVPHFASSFLFYFQGI